MMDLVDLGKNILYYLIYYNTECDNLTAGDINVWF
jgi:hypothetical protein